MRLTKDRAETVEHAPLNESKFDEDLAQHLKYQAYEATLQSLDDKHLVIGRISASILREEIAAALEIVLGVEGVSLSFAQRSKLIEEIEHEISGLGPIQPLLQDPFVNDIIVNG
jgi:pilus assembly protein CpaF